jgi:hypothetical protein
LDPNLLPESAREQVKKLFVIIALLSLTGCATVEMKGSHAISGIVKLNRKVTLYNNDGVPIREWSGRIMTEANGGGVTFMLDGKRVSISGTYVIEEVR